MSAVCRQYYSSLLFFCFPFSLGLKIFCGVGFIVVDCCCCCLHWFENAFEISANGYCCCNCVHGNNSHFVHENDHFIYTRVADVAQCTFTHTYARSTFACKYNSHGNGFDRSSAETWIVMFEFAFNVHQRLWFIGPCVLSVTLSTELFFVFFFFSIFLTQSAMAKGKAGNSN